MPFAERPAENEEIEGRVVLSETDARAAARLFRMLSEAVGYFPDSDRSAEGPISPEELTSRARIILHSRQVRERYFSRAMFGEPAWDMLLVLYITDMSEGRQTITNLAKRTEMPLSTVVRWLDYLEKEKLIERQPHPTNRRSFFIRLLPKARKAMGEYLTEMVWRPT
jgi:DNA-binding MarR family transcriptional regulator